MKALVDTGVETLEYVSQSQFPKRQEGREANR